MSHLYNMIEQDTGTNLCLVFFFFINFLLSVVMGGQMVAHLTMDLDGSDSQLLQP